MLLGGESGSGIRVSMDWFINFRRQQKIIYSFVMGREKNYNVESIFRLPNVGRTKEEIFDHIKDVEI